MSFPAFPVEEPDQTESPLFVGGLKPELKQSSIADNATTAEFDVMNALPTALSMFPDPPDARWLNKSTLLRFARARDADKKKSLEMLEAAILWRKEYKPYLIRAEDMMDILALKTVYLCGVCKMGRPVLYMIPGAKNPFPAEKRVQLMVFLLEETQRLGYEKLTWVFDWSEFANRAKDPESSKTREQVIHILQNYYPERLGALYMVQTPWFFSALYTIISPFIDKRTRAKIFQNIKPEQLLEYIAEDQLIEKFGGKQKVIREGENTEPLMRSDSGKCEVTNEEVYKAKVGEK